MKKILTTAIFFTIIGLLSITAQTRIYTPQLVKPVDLAIAQSPNAVLDWTAVTGGNTGIITYELRVDTDPAFPNPMIFTTEFVTGYEMHELMFGETYYWKVRAKDGNDVSEWTETWSFTVINFVQTETPTEAAEKQKPTLELTWKHVTGVTEFDFQFDTLGFWEQVSVPVTGNLTAAFTIDEGHAWIVGAGGKVVYFDGTTYTEQTSSTTKDLAGVFFLDASNGWAVGKTGAVIYYNGTEWVTQVSSTDKDLFSVWFLDASNGWAVGKDGKIIHYDGTSWSGDSYSAGKDLYSVVFTDSGHGFAVGKAGTAARYDGSSWSTIDAGTPRDLYACAFVNENLGYAGGKSGLLMEYRNGAWTTYGNQVADKDITGMVITPAGGWAVGKTGTVLQFDGTEWFKSSAGVKTNILGVSFNGSQGHIAGEGGLVAEYSPDAFTSEMAQAIHIVQGTDSAATVKELLFNETYYWRMRTRHAQATSPWSGARSFKTMSEVTLSDPENNETGTGLAITLKWDKVVDNILYEVQVDDNPDFSSPAITEVETLTLDAQVAAFNTSYYWRVRAKHAHDASDWQAAWKFTTVNKLTLLSPANNATDQKQSPLLTWGAITGVDGYQVQLATSNTFTEPLVSTLVNDGTAKLSVPVVLEKNTQYYWRVRAYRGLDSCNWADPWSFTTVPPVGITEQGVLAGLSVYPNPASEKLFIQMDQKFQEPLVIMITDLLGKSILEQTVRNEAAGRIHTLDVASLPKGVYMLRMQTGTNAMTTKLIISR